MATKRKHLFYKLSRTRAQHQDIIMPDKKCTMLIATILHVTIMTGQFSNLLHLVIIYGATDRHEKMSKNVIKKLKSPLFMTPDLIKFIKSCEYDHVGVKIEHNEDLETHKSN